MNWQGCEWQQLWPICSAVQAFVSIMRKIVEDLSHASWYMSQVLKNEPLECKTSSVHFM